MSSRTSSLLLLALSMALTAGCSASPAADAGGPRDGGSTVGDDGGGELDSGSVDADAGRDAGGDADAGLDGSVVRPPLPTGALTIGIWCGPPLGYLTQARLNELAAAGFTHAANPCEASSNVPSFNLKMLDYAADAGLKTIVSDDRLAQAISAADRATKMAAVVADYQGKPALFGYHLVDEPGAGSFPGIAAVVQQMAVLDPAHPAIVNLLPTYGGAFTGTPTYDAYVADFVRIVKPKVFSYDHYNFLTAGENGDFFDNLNIVRAHAQSASTPWWQYIQAISFVGHRATTGPEKRWAALHTVAYGGTGVMYFTYWTPPQTGENFGLGLIGRDGTQTSQYAEATAINHTLSAIGKYVSVATWTGVFHNGTLASSALPRAPGAAVYVPGPAPLTVASFTVNDESYALLVNRNFAGPTESDVWAVSHEVPPEALDVATGQWHAVTALASDPVKGTRFHLSLTAGDGLLLHLRGATLTGAPGAEAFVGTVRADAGLLHVLDTSFGVQALRGASWDECPAGYSFRGHAFSSNGFWLCTRNDLAARTFYVGNVVNDQASLYQLQGTTTTFMRSASWGDCDGHVQLGQAFHSNGFWVCAD